MSERSFEGWAIVSEVTVAGAAMLRLDVPSEPPVTQFYGGSAIYCITPTTEELARQVAAASRPASISRYELPAAAQRKRVDIVLRDDAFDDEPDHDPDADDEPDHDPDAVHEELP